MDFIKQLPNFSSFTAILVIIDRVSKPALFIPIHDTITSPKLAKLFLLHIVMTIPGQSWSCHLRTRQSQSASTRLD